MKLTYNAALALAGTGTVASIFLPRRWHMAFGALWAGLSLVHVWKRRKALQHEIMGEIKSDVQTAEHAWHRLQVTQGAKFYPLLRSMTCAFYMPGRMRLYNSVLVRNPKLAAQLSTYFDNHAAIKEIRIGQQTGSLLLLYDPQALSQDPELAAIEAYVKKHAQRRIELGEEK